MERLTKEEIEKEIDRIKRVYGEFIGKKCTECGTTITSENNNGDGLCIICVFDVLNDI